MKGLIEFQSIMARLYVDQAYRDHFFDKQEAVSDGFELIYQQNLKGLKKSQVEIFAKSLILKRFGIVMGMLPLIEKYYLEKGREFFMRYALCKPLQLSSGKYNNDRNGFIAFLKKEAKGDLAVLAGLYSDDINMSNAFCFICKKQNYQLDRFWDVVTDSPQEAKAWVVHIKLQGKILLSIKC